MISELWLLEMSDIGRARTSAAVEPTVNIRLGDVMVFSESTTGIFLHFFFFYPLFGHQKNLFSFTSTDSYLCKLSIVFVFMLLGMHIPFQWMQYELFDMTAYHDISSNWSCSEGTKLNRTKPDNLDDSRKFPADTY